MYMRSRTKTGIAASIIVTAIFAVIFHNMPVKADASEKENKKLARRLSVPADAPEAGCMVLYEVDGKMGCRQATYEEAKEMMVRDPNLRLRPINKIRPSQEAGLKIVLRGTSQLESFPQAKAAFLKAAATWEALIQTPLTIVIDVDFGSTRFGEPYKSGVIGATSTQTLGADDIYSDVRLALIEGASNEQERAIYKALPEKDLPTDLGTTNTVFAPSSVYRALGAIDPVADPDTEKENFGAPPAIGFNSFFKYDFDPSNGIDGDKIDFDATAVHEIGHALGFASNTGLQEIVSSARNAVTIWDLFRFRPGASMDTFAKAQRILSSGGTQVFYVGNTTVGLSTGRPNGTGGDGAQASHWKAGSGVGQRNGIMEPFLAEGDRVEINENDLKAIDIFGFQLKGQINPGDQTPPTVKVVAPASGETVQQNTETTISWTSSDNVGIARHDIALSTDGGATFPVTIATGLAGNTQSFRWTVPAIEIPQARIKVTATDAANNQGFDTGAGNFSVVKNDGTSADFSLAILPGQQTITAGTSATFSVNVQAIGEFTQAINLNVSTSSSTGDVTATLSSNSINPGSNATLTVNTASTTPASTVVLTITGSGGQIVHTTSVTLNVVAPDPDFEIFFIPEVAFVVHGQSGQFGANIKRIGGFTGKVTVTSPNTKDFKIKIKQQSVTTEGTVALFDFKIKKKAPIVDRTLTFTARDESGRTRTASFLLIIQE
jgi:hypothetical protein